MSYLLPGKRAKELASVAAANRLRFTQEDTAACTEIPFTLFVQGTGQSAQNVMTGRLGGVTVRGFDFPYLRNDRAITQESLGRPGRPPVVPYEDGKAYSCALVGVTGELPFLHIAPRSRKRLLPDEMELSGLRKDLGKSYQLWALDPERAAAMLTDDVVDILVSTKGKFEFEMQGPGVLSMVVGIRGEDFPGLMAMTVRLAEAAHTAAAALPAAGPPTAAPPAVAAPEPATAPPPAPPATAPPPAAPPPAAPPPAAPGPPPAPTPAAPMATPPPEAEPAASAPVAVDATSAVADLPPAPPDATSLPLPPPPPDAEGSPLPPPPVDA